MISLIWAMDKNNLIGKGNLLPWHYKKDLIYFKEKVKDKTVLMGMNTYKSMKYYYKDKPFPFKKTYVASLSETSLSDATLVNDVTSFLKDNKEDLFVIGGKAIYKIAIDFADVLYITIINKDHEGDLYLDNLDYSNFKLTSSIIDECLDFRKYERME